MCVLNMFLSKTKLDRIRFQTSRMFSKFEVAIHNWYLVHLKGDEKDVKEIFEKEYIQNGLNGLLSVIHSLADSFHSERCEYYTDCPKCMKFFKLL